MKKLPVIILIVCGLLAYAPEGWAQSSEDMQEYTVGADDILEINVLQPEKLTVTATVSPDGAITFPYIGNVQVKKMSLNQIQEEIQAKLSDGYMKYPLISVILKESRSRKFFVYGDVNKPGAYSMEQNTSVLKAISIAGGFSKNSPSSKVEVLRPRQDEAGYEKTDVDIKAVMKGNARADILLNPGDTIIVSEGKFFVYGDVNKPGVYSMEDQISVLKAVSLAGGFSKNASNSKVKLLRRNEQNEGQETIAVDIKAALKGSPGTDITLLAGDTVIVSEGKVFVYGEVAKPGVYSMEDDMTVLKAISLAGGFSKNASSSRVKVMRQKKDQEGQETIEVNIKQIMQNAPEKDMPLQPGDTVLISEGKFFVYGEVNRPGVYYMEDNITVLKAIAIAGGLSKFGSSGKVKILRPLPAGGYDTYRVNIKDIMDGSAESDIMLQPGDTVVVMEGLF
ncbi:MAG: SLBB domain-containing protein [Candidatus Omnitrophica bacterium]|nr:SLBB domain-containing protein [Candidatus Omnitrophota bacterium]